MYLALVFTRLFFHKAHPQRRRNHLLRYSLDCIRQTGSLWFQRRSHAREPPYLIPPCARSQARVAWMARQDQAMFYRLGLATVRWRFWIIAAWALVVLAALPFAPRAAEALSPGGFGSPDMESQQAVTALEQGLHTNFTSVLVIFSS